MTLRQGLKAGGVIVILAVFVAVLAPVQALLVAFRAKAADRLPMDLWRLFLRLTGVRVRVIGAPAAVRPLLLCANHVSWLDIAVIGSVLPVSFIAKAEVGRWPAIGALARLQSTIFIDWTRKSATAETNAVIADRLAAGDALVLFPEGTTGDGNKLLPFRSSLLGGVREAVLRVDTDDVMTVQSVALGYRGYRGLPMGRHVRARYSWAGDTTLLDGLITVLTDGVIEIDVCFGPSYGFGPETDRKAMARVLERDVRVLLRSSLIGREAVADSGADAGLLTASDSV